MDRRDFLKMLGGAALVAVVPATTRMGVMETRYALPGGVGGTRIAGLVLPCNGGQRSRSVITVAAATQLAWIQTHSARGTLGVRVGENVPWGADWAVREFSMPTCVVVSEDAPLVVDYEAPEDILLALTYRTFGALPGLC